jgi:hypothetical protein
MAVDINTEIDMEVRTEREGTDIRRSHKTEIRHGHKHSLWQHAQEPTNKQSQRSRGRGPSCMVIPKTNVFENDNGQTLGTENNRDGGIARSQSHQRD